MEPQYLSSKVTEAICDRTLPQPCKKTHSSWTITPKVRITLFLLQQIRIRSRGRLLLV